MHLCWILLLLFCGTHSYEVVNSHDAMMYLNRFGYIKDEEMSDKSDMSTSSMKPMLKKFQQMCNITQSGILDSKTMDMMNEPRCGNLDMDLNGHHSMFLMELGEGNKVTSERYRRFAITDKNYRWTKRELTYKMGMFSENMGLHVSQDMALRQLHHAFNLWSEVTNLDFIYRPNDKKVDIELSFTMRYHTQDLYPFDGVGKTLAHAFPPGEGVLGDVHFDDEENWTVDSPKGINVLFVAVHEIGHALGLSHSMVKGAIMQPFYGGYSPKLQLHPDDIDGIRSLYGTRDRRQPDSENDVFTSQKGPKIETPRPPAPTRPPPTKPSTTTDRNVPFTISPVITRPDLCRDPKLDAITTLANGSIFAFKGNYVFQIDSKGRGILPGWPHRIESIFKGLDGNLDAAVTRKNGKSYFFKGAYYWRFVGTEMDPGYPKKISIHFRGIPDNIDSAFEWLNAIYFTKGDKIWRFDPSSKPFVTNKYPIPLQLWNLGNEVPQIDASFTAPNGHVYFFYNQLYWRFDEYKFKVKNNISPAYPRISKIWWFGCNGGLPNNDVDYRKIRKLEMQDANGNENGYYYGYANDY